MTNLSAHRVALIGGAGFIGHNMALALKEREDVEITVLDIGLQLEPDGQRIGVALAQAEIVRGKYRTCEQYGGEREDGGVSHHFFACALRVENVMWTLP